MSTENVRHMTTDTITTLDDLEPLETKVCAYTPCGNTFSRMGRPAGNWAKMRFCSPKCANAQRALDRKDRQSQRTGESKPCANTKRCDNQVYRTQSMSAREWELRLYCSKRCIIESEPKPCANEGCKEVIRFDPESTAPNALRNYEAKKYCSPVCRAQGMRKKGQVRNSNQHRQHRQRPVTVSHRLAPVSEARDIPDAPPREAAPVWRPPGWSKVPNTKRRAS